MEGFELCYLFWFGSNPEKNFTTKLLAQDSLD
jgi:hypothetical protein